MADSNEYLLIVGDGVAVDQRAGRYLFVLKIIQYLRWPVAWVVIYALIK